MTKRQRIIENLKQKKDYLINLGYNEDRILGIFLYGSQNYNLDTEASDIDALAIVLPSFSDFCLGKQVVSKEIVLEDESHILIKDLGSFRNEILKQNLCRIEILFTEYYIIHSKYESLFYNYFQKERNNVAYINKSKGMQAVWHQARHEFKEYERILTNKKLRNIYRLLYYLEIYNENEDLDSAIKLEGEIREKLFDLTRGRLSQEEVNEMVAEIKTKIENFDIDNLAGANVPIKRQEAGIAALDTGTIEIFKMSFFESAPSCTKEEFFDYLTNAEERAYKSIILEIKDEGNITISRLVEKNSISRPVYNNLLIKMKEYDVAEISNMGMKGTYIKITHPELRAEAKK